MYRSGTLLSLSRRAVYENNSKENYPKATNRPARCPRSQRRLWKRHCEFVGPTSRSGVTGKFVASGLAYLIPNGRKFIPKSLCGSQWQARRAVLPSSVRPKSTSQVSVLAVALLALTHVPLPGSEACTHNKCLAARYHNTPTSYHTLVVSVCSYGTALAREVSHNSIVSRSTILLYRIYARLHELVCAGSSTCASLPPDFTTTLQNMQARIELANSSDIGPNVMVRSLIMLTLLFSETVTFAFTPTPPLLRVPRCGY